jgi:hypothetical protein
MAKASKAIEVQANAPKRFEHPLIPAASTTQVGHAISSDLSSLYDDMPTGFENMTAADVLIPRLTILQGLSPQVTQGKPEFQPDARVGDIFDVALSQRFPKGILYLPVYFVEQWLEWAPRNTGKGLQGIHTTDRIMQETERDEKHRNVLPNGNYVAPTYQLYGYNIPAGWRKSYIPFASTQRKACQEINTAAREERITLPSGRVIPAPLYSRTRALTTGPKTNAEGTWMIWKQESGPALDEIKQEEELYEFLKNDVKPFINSLIAGTVKGDVEGMGDEFTGTTIDGDSTPM